MGDVLERWRAMREQADRGRVVGSSIPCKLGDELAAELEKHHERYVTESLDVVKELQAELQSYRARIAAVDAVVDQWEYATIGDHGSYAAGVAALTQVIRKALADPGEK